MSDIRRFSIHPPVFLVCLVVLLAAGSASAQTHSPGRISISVEGLNVWQQRNDVRIPLDTGTEFSIVDLLGSSPTPSVRVVAAADVTDRQQIQVVYAPLELSGSGTPAMPIAFAGTTFETVPTEAVYEFSSYRATWSFRVHEGPTWAWRVGVTGFVRDARIALTQTDRTAEDTDIGFVPLGHVSADARLSERWSTRFVLDGSAAPRATRSTSPPRWSIVQHREGRCSGAIGPWRAARTLTPSIRSRRSMQPSSEYDCASDSCTLLAQW